MTAPKEVTELVAKWRKRVEEMRFAGEIALALEVSECANELESALAATPAVGEGAESMFPDAHNWPEDAAQENGSYCNTCSECKRVFIGHKRRVMCRVCANAPAPDTTAPVWVDAETYEVIRVAAAILKVPSNHAAMQSFVTRLRVAGEVQGE